MEFFEDAFRAQFAEVLLKIIDCHNKGLLLFDLWSEISCVDDPSDLYELIRLIESPTLERQIDRALLCPEIINGGIHTPSTDVWIFGSLLKRHLNAHLRHFNVNESMSYSDPSLSLVYSLIDGCLEEDPSFRMSWAAILSHPWWRSNDLTDERFRDALRIVSTPTKSIFSGFSSASSVDWKNARASSNPLGSPIPGSGSLMQSPIVGKDTVSSLGFRSPEIAVAAAIATMNPHEESESPFTGEISQTELLNALNSVNMSAIETPKSSEAAGGTFSEVLHSFADVSMESTPLNRSIASVSVENRLLSPLLHADVSRQSAKVLRTPPRLATSTSNSFSSVASASVATQTVPLRPATGGLEGRSVSSPPPRPPTSILRAYAPVSDHPNLPAEPSSPIPAPSLPARIVSSPPRAPLAPLPLSQAFQPVEAEAELLPGDSSFISYDSYDSADYEREPVTELGDHTAVQEAPSDLRKGIAARFSRLPQNSSILESTLPSAREFVPIAPLGSPAPYSLHGGAHPNNPHFMETLSLEQPDHRKFEHLVSKSVPTTPISETRSRSSLPPRSPPVPALQRRLQEVSRTVQAAAEPSESYPGVLPNSSVDSSGQGLMYGPPASLESTRSDSSFLQDFRALRGPVEEASGLHMQLESTPFPQNSISRSNSHSNVDIAKSANQSADDKVTQHSKLSTASSTHQSAGDEFIEFSQDFSEVQAASTVILDGSGGNYSVEGSLVNEMEPRGTLRLAETLGSPSSPSGRLVNTFKMMKTAYFTDTNEDAGAEKVETAPFLPPTDEEINRSFDCGLAEELNSRMGVTAHVGDDEIMQAMDSGDGDVEVQSVRDPPRPILKHSPSSASSSLLHTAGHAPGTPPARRTAGPSVSFAVELSAISMPHDYSRVSIEGPVLNESLSLSPGNEASLGSPSAGIVGASPSNLRREGEETVSRRIPFSLLSDSGVVAQQSHDRSNQDDSSLSAPISFEQDSLEEPSFNRDNSSSSVLENSHQEISHEEISHEEISHEEISHEEMSHEEKSHLEEEEEEGHPLSPVPQRHALLRRKDMMPSPVATFPIITSLTDGSTVSVDSRRQLDLPFPAFGTESEVLLLESAILAEYASPSENGDNEGGFNAHNIEFVGPHGTSRGPASQLLKSHVLAIKEALVEPGAPRHMTQAVIEYILFLCGISPVLSCLLLNSVVLEALLRLAAAPGPGWTPVAASAARTVALLLQQSPVLLEVSESRAALAHTLFVLVRAPLQAADPSVSREDLLLVGIHASEALAELVFYKASAWAHESSEEHPGDEDASVQQGDWIDEGVLELLMDVRRSFSSKRHSNNNNSKEHLMILPLLHGLANVSRAVPGATDALSFGRPLIAVSMSLAAALLVNTGLNSSASDDSSIPLSALQVLGANLDLREVHLRGLPASLLLLSAASHETVSSLQMEGRESALSVFRSRRALADAIELYLSLHQALYSLLHSGVLAASVDTAAASILPLLAERSAAGEGRDDSMEGGEEFSTLLTHLDRVRRVVSSFALLTGAGSRLHLLLQQRLVQTEDVDDPNSEEGLFGVQLDELRDLLSSSCFAPFSEAAAAAGSVLAALLAETAVVAHLCTLFISPPSANSIHVHTLAESCLALLGACAWLSHALPQVSLGPTSVVPDHWVALLLRSQSSFGSNPTSQLEHVISGTGAPSWGLLSLVLPSAGPRLDILARVVAAASGSTNSDAVAIRVLSRELSQPPLLLLLTTLERCCSALPKPGQGQLKGQQLQTSCQRIVQYIWRSLFTTLLLGLTPESSEDSSSQEGEVVPVRFGKALSQALPFISRVLVQLADAHLTLYPSSSSPLRVWLGPVRSRGLGTELLRKLAAAITVLAVEAEERHSFHEFMENESSPSGAVGACLELALFIVNALSTSAVSTPTAGDASEEELLALILLLQANARALLLGPVLRCLPGISKRDFPLSASHRLLAGSGAFLRPLARRADLLCALLQQLLRFQTGPVSSRKGSSAEEVFPQRSRARDLFASLLMSEEELQRLEEPVKPEEGHYSSEALLELSRVLFPEDSCFEPNELELVDATSVASYALFLRSAGELVLVLCQFLTNCGIFLEGRALQRSQDSELDQPLKQDPSKDGQFTEWLVTTAHEADRTAQALVAACASVVRLLGATDVHLALLSEQIPEAEFDRFSPIFELLHGSHSSSQSSSVLSSPSGPSGRAGRALHPRRVLGAARQGLDAISASLLALLTTSLADSAPDSFHPKSLRRIDVGQRRFATVSAFVFALTECAFPPPLSAAALPSLAAAVGLAIQAPIVEQVRGEGGSAASVAAVQARLLEALLAAVTLAAHSAAARSSRIFRTPPSPADSSHHDVSSPFLRDNGDDAAAGAASGDGERFPSRASRTSFVPMRAEELFAVANSGFGGGVRPNEQGFVAAVGALAAVLRSPRSRRGSRAPDLATVVNALLARGLRLSTCGSGLSQPEDPPPPTFIAFLDAEPVPLPGFDLEIDLESDFQNEKSANDVEKSEGTDLDPVDEDWRIFLEVLSSYVPFCLACAAICLEIELSGDPNLTRGVDKSILLDERKSRIALILLCSKIIYICGLFAPSSASFSALFGGDNPLATSLGEVQHAVFGSNLDISVVLEGPPVIWLTRAIVAFASAPPHCENESHTSCGCCRSDVFRWAVSSIRILSKTADEVRLAIEHYLDQELL